MSGKAGGKSANKRPIIIRREEVVEGGHHGGAWKVAYADFVTAMMAFFLLMWLLNATTDEQRRGLADYFSPLNPLAHGASGAGQPFGGKTPFETGELVSDRGVMSVVIGRDNERAPQDEPNNETSLPRTMVTVGSGEENGRAGTLDGVKTGSNADAGLREPVQPGLSSGTAAQLARLQDPAGKTIASTAAASEARQLTALGSKSQAAAAIATHAAADAAALRAEQERREGVAFAEAAQQIRDAVRGDRLLADVSSQLSIDITPEGLRIQLLDEDRRPMFALGSAAMNDRARLLLLKVAPVLMKLGEPIAIAGHTDGAAFRAGDKGNWELSSERANATRRLLAEAGLAEARVRSVTGNADRELLLPAEPLAAANRRIAITVLRTAGRPIKDPPQPGSGPAEPLAGDRGRGL